MKDRLSPLISGNAYRILCDEISQHLEQAKLHLTLATSWPSPDQARLLGTKFHMLHGGAGFFGLEEVASTSAALEHLLLKSTDDPGQKLERAKVLVEQLRLLAKDLPPPAKENKA
jgi:HPt (histidine-containing phosphotransfer) domain-containing protein